jgi:hypothetical protein
VTTARATLADLKLAHANALDVLTRLEPSDRSNQRWWFEYAADLAERQQREAQHLRSLEKKVPAHSRATFPAQSHCRDFQLTVSSAAMVAQALGCREMLWRVGWRWQDGPRQ